MKHLKKYLKYLAIVAIVATFSFATASADVTTGFWTKNATQSLVTNGGNGLANDDIHVRNCYIGLGTSTPCGSGVVVPGVSSVGLSLPAAVFNISGSPVTSTGTLTGTFDNQNANLVFAGPATGAATTPTFRALVAADLPPITIAEPNTEVVFGTGTGITTDADFTFDPTNDFNVLAVNDSIIRASNAITIQAMAGGSAGDIFINNDTFGNNIRFFGSGAVDLTAAAAQPLNMLGDGGVSLKSNTGDVTIGSNGLFGLVVVGNATPDTSALRFSNFDSGTATGTGAPIGVDSGGNVITLDPADFPSTPTPPAPPDRSVQWNDGLTAFGGSANFLFDTNESLVMGGVDVTSVGSFGMAHGTASGGGVIHVGSGSLAFGTSSDFGDIDATDEASMAFGISESGGLINSGQASLAFGHSQDSGSQISGSDSNLAFGTVETNGSIAANSTGALASGSATNGSGNIGTSGIYAAGVASIAMGSSSGLDDNNVYSKITTNTTGGQVFGEASDGGWLTSDGNGGYVSGTAIGSNNDGFQSQIQTQDSGAQARGLATNGGLINAASVGSTAVGVASGFTDETGQSIVQVFGESSFAMGSAESGAKISSEASGSMVFGVSIGNDGVSLPSRIFSEGGSGGGASGSLAHGVAEDGGFIHNNFGDFSGDLRGQGSTAFGVAVGGADGSVSTIETNASGSQAFGYTLQNGIIRTDSNGRGAMAFGYAIGTAALISTSGNGTDGGGLAFGKAQDGGQIHATLASLAFGAAFDTSSIITTIDDGAFAGGEVSGAGAISANEGGAMAFGFSTEEAVIEAASQGSQAFGYALGTGSSITASGLGAMAMGAAIDNGGSITSSGEGSFAGGGTGGLGSITASGRGSFAFGAPNNASIVASGQGSFAFGDAAIAEGFVSVAMGTQVHVNSGADNSMIFGTSSTIGSGSVFSMVFGQSNSIAASLSNSMAIGHAVTVSASNVYAIGDTFTASTANAFNVGFGALDFQVKSSEVKIPYLGDGIQTRIVTADSNGVLGTTQTLPLVNSVQIIGDNTNQGPSGFVTSPGMYRISYVLETPTADLTAGTETVTFAWTDDSGATSSSSSALPLTVVGRTSGTIVLYLTSGTLTYATTHTGIFGSAVYNLRATAEKLL